MLGDGPRAGGGEVLLRQGLLVRGVLRGAASDRRANSFRRRRALADWRRRGRNWESTTRGIVFQGAGAPPSLPGWARITIGERALRILITMLISLFLADAGAGAVPAAGAKPHDASRRAEPPDPALCDRGGPAHQAGGTRADPVGLHAASPSPRTISTRPCCPRRSAEGRIFAFVNADGHDHRQPSGIAIAPRRASRSPMSCQSVSSPKPRSTTRQMTRLTLASGEEAYVAHQRSLAARRQPARHPEARRCHARLEGQRHAGDACCSSSPSSCS